MNILEKQISKLKYKQVPKTIKVKESYLKELKIFTNITDEISDVKGYMGVYTGIPIVIDDNINNNFQIEFE